MNPGKAFLRLEGKPAIKTIILLHGNKKLSKCAFSKKNTEYEELQEPNKSLIVSPTSTF
jgi:hypothetical protein